jgi:Fe-S-cluster containining protein
MYNQKGLCFMTTFTGNQILNDLQFDLNKDYELIIIDPETDVKTRIRIKKVGYFVNINPESIIHTLINYYDAIENDNKHSPNITCHKGCSDCCSNDFEISITEYFMILNYLGIRYGQDYLEQCSKKAIASHSASNCIFIDCTNGSCSIYEVRPLVCRKYGLYDCSINCKKLDEESELLFNAVSTDENTLFFRHSSLPEKKFACPPKRIVHWFGNLKDGKLASEKMKKLFYESFNGSSDTFVETLFK